MHILVLGGTKFVGRHVVETALARGHRVTLFNRGQTNAELFPEVEKLRGDRDGDLAAVAGRSFDAVVDPSGYVPRIVRETIHALGDVGHYTFVSSISAYGTFEALRDEDSPVATLDRDTEEIDGDTYGPLKALCEDVVRERFPEAFVVRPGLISGPWDPTGRFTYWPSRVADGGPVLAPAPPERPAQIVDVRDLAAWIVDSLEQGRDGTLNAISPIFTFSELLATCREVAGSDAEPVWVDASFLAQHEVEEWMELPLWIDDPKFRRMLEVDPGRALANGLRIRPLADTVRDTLEWVLAGLAPADPPAGLDRGKEQQLLDEWRSKG